MLKILKRINAWFRARFPLHLEIEQKESSDIELTDETGSRPKPKPIVHIWRLLTKNAEGNFGKTREDRIFLEVEYPKPAHRLYGDTYRHRVIKLATATKMHCDNCGYVLGNYILSDIYGNKTIVNRDGSHLKLVEGAWQDIVQLQPHWHDELVDLLFRRDGEVLHAIMEKYGDGKPLFNLNKHKKHYLTGAFSNLILMKENMDTNKIKANLEIMKNNKKVLEKSYYNNLELTKEDKVELVQEIEGITIAIEEHEKALLTPEELAEYEATLEARRARFQKKCQSSVGGAQIVERKEE